MQNDTQSTPMKIYSGHFLLPAPAPAAGKLFFESGDLPTRAEAVLYVCSSLPATLPSHTVGVVLLSSDRQIPVPALDVPIFVLPDLPRRYDGKIALLEVDPPALTVCPDLSSISRYTERLKTASERIRSAEIPNYVLPRFSSTEEPKAHDTCGYLLDWKAPTDSPEQIRKQLSSQVSARAPASVTLVTEADESCYPLVIGAYLSGVLGRLSLLFRNIFCPSDWQKALQMCHRCYCELCESGREFNGYLPRGILLDTPLALHSETPFVGMDFVCVDYGSLCRHYGGRSSANPHLLRREIERHLCAFFERHPHTERKIWLMEEPNDAEISFWLRQQTDEVFLPRSLLLSVQKRFAETAQRAETSDL